MKKYALEECCWKAFWKNYYLYADFTSYLSNSPSLSGCHAPALAEALLISLCWGFCGSLLPSIETPHPPPHSYQERSLKSPPMLPLCTALQRVTAKLLPTAAEAVQPPCPVSFHDGPVTPALHLDLESVQQGLFINSISLLAPTHLTITPWNAAQGLAVLPGLSCINTHPDKTNRSFSSQALTVFCTHFS